MPHFIEPSTFTPRHRLWLALVAAFYAAFTVVQWSWGYIDFGDGNYMYIASRIADGAVPYRDILAPQPPVHLYLGAGLAWIGRVADIHPLWCFRAFSVLLRLATFLLIAGVTRRAWGRPAVGVIAGIVYLWLPIGHWWSLGYQSEPTEIFFLVAMMAAALREDWRGDFWAGVFAALAALTNATAAPILAVLIVFMMLHAPVRALRMAIPCVALAGLVTWMMQSLTGGAYWTNIFSNQAGTFITDAAQAVAKVIAQTSKVLVLEGAFVFVGLIGLWRYLRESPLGPLSRAGLAWFFVASLGAIVYVTKGGTVDYIFTLSEPAVAVLAAGELAAWGKRWRRLPTPELHPHYEVFSVPYLTVKLAGAALLAAFALGPGLNFHRLLWTQQAYEYDAESARKIAHRLKRAASPEEPVLAPPFYAFIADRRLLEDYSELYIWTVNYRRDRIEGNPGGPGWTRAREIAQALRRRQVPIAVLEMRQTGTIPEIMMALQDAYVPQESTIMVETEGRVVPQQTMLVATLNTRLGVFVPSREVETPEETRERLEMWAKFKSALLREYGAENVRWLFGSWYNLAPAGGAAGAGAIGPAGAAGTTGAGAAASGPVAGATPEPTATAMPEPTATPVAATATTTAATTPTTTTAPASSPAATQPGEQ